MSDFDRSLTFVLSAEGGYANNPHDRGKETYKGISRNANPSWPGWVKVDAAKASGILSHQELNQILGADSELQAEVAVLYKAKYWIPIRGDELPWPVNCVVFDCGINIGPPPGPPAAIKLLQHALTIKEDGILGPVTLGEIGKWTTSNLVGKYLSVRKQFYEDIVANDETQSRFLVGWMNRLEHLNKFISEVA